MASSKGATRFADVFDCRRSRFQRDNNEVGNRWDSSNEFFVTWVAVATTRDLRDMQSLLINAGHVSKLKMTNSIKKLKTKTPGFSEIHIYHFPTGSESSLFSPHNWSSPIFFWTSFLAFSIYHVGCCGNHTCPTPDEKCDFSRFTTHHSLIRWAYCVTETPGVSRRSTGGLYEKRSLFIW